MEKTAQALLVSIGLPIYSNRPLSLRRALESILAQTHTHFELVISDNASPYPEISAIGQEYAQRDRRIRYIRQPANVGLDNYKLLPQLASKGAYFMWMADDDTWAPEFISHTLALLQAHPQAAMAIPTVEVQNKQGDVIRHLGSFARYTHGPCRLASVLRYTWEAEVHGKANLLYGLYRREALNAALAFWGPRHMETCPFGDVVFLTALQARYAVIGSPLPMLRKGMPTTEPVWVAKEPMYQTFAFAEWPSYTLRLVAVMPTPLGKTAMATLMALRLLHKAFIALPYKIGSVLLRRIGLKK